MKVSEPPTRFGVLEQVSRSIAAFIIPTGNGEQFLVFGILRGLGSSKTFRGIDLVDKDFTEASSQFSAILNAEGWKSHSNWKL